jgi:hypothetical protein
MIFHDVWFTEFRDRELQYSGGMDLVPFTFEV